MRHSIRKETLNVKVPTQETAWDLQPRLRDFNRNHLLPVIEQVLDELAVEGRQIRIPAIRLDLGQLPREGFEALAAERLDHELRKALAEAIASVIRDGVPGSQSQSEDESQLDALEHYLQFGKLPFWGTPAVSFSLETALLELLDRDPSGVHRLIRKLARRPWGIQRLVFQLTELTLGRLLSLLQPQSAGLIIAGMLELPDIQRDAMVPAGSRSRFATLLWISAFTYLLHEQGAQFNHASFVRYSLGCIADHESLDFLELLSSLERAAPRLEKGRVVDSTLLTAIRELVREEDIGGARSSDEPLPASEKVVPPSDSTFQATVGEVVEEEQITGSDSPAHEPFADSSELIPFSIAELSTLTEDSILAWIKKLLPQTGESANLFLTALRDHAGGAEDRRAFYFRVLRAMREGKFLDLEELSRTTSRGQVLFPQMEVREEQTTEPHLPAHKPLGDSSELIPSSIEDVSTLTEEAILAWIKKLLPQTGEIANMFWTALMAHAAGVEDKRAFYFRVLRTMQEGKILDLEELLRTTSRGQILFPQMEVRETTEPHLPAHKPLGDSSELVPPAIGDVSTLTEEAILAWIKKLLPQTEGAANVFWTALMAHAAGAEDKSAFYSRVLRTMQEGKILDLEELSKASPEEQAILPQLEEAGEELESKAEHQIRPPVGQSTADGETHLPIMPDTAASGLPQRFAKEQERHQPGRQRPDVPATRVRSAFSMPESQPSLPAGEPIYIDNAGLVLTAPFLPMLLNSLNMLRKDENGKSHWPNHETASRGVHLLQYLVDERVNAPEPLLVLNKLLCGLPLAMPVEKSITMTEIELETCQKLLRSMLANWKALAGTSIAGLRETFFQRQGRLEQSDLYWKLQVQRKTVDVLVDQIPWNIAVIFHVWMPGALNVTW